MSSESAKVTRAVEEFSDSLDEALVRFVPLENRAAMVAFFRQRLDHDIGRY
jgi:hypothetical protein